MAFRIYAKKVEKTRKPSPAFQFLAELVINGSPDKMHKDILYLCKFLYKLYKFFKFFLIYAKNVVILLFFLNSAFFVAKLGLAICSFLLYDKYRNKEKRQVRQVKSKPKLDSQKIFSKKLKKGLDKSNRLWYNKHSQASDNTL